jgi:MFS family permease
MILIFGFCGAGRAGIGYLYLLELVRPEWKTMAGTLSHATNSVTFIFSAIYFWYISKDWRWLVLYSLIANGITAIAVLFIPESPLYSHSVRDYDKARESLNKIAKFNSSDIVITEIFQEEQEYLEKQLASK